MHYLYQGYIRENRIQNYHNAPECEIYDLGRLHCAPTQASAKNRSPAFFCSIRPTSSARAVLKEEVQIARGRVVPPRAEGPIWLGAAH